MNKWGKKKELEVAKDLRKINLEISRLILQIYTKCACGKHCHPFLRERTTKFTRKTCNS